MARLVYGLLVLSSVCAVAYLGPVAPLMAAPADKNGAPEASGPKDAAAPEPGKPHETPPPDAKAEEAAPATAGEIKSGVKMKGLLDEGFLIRTTVLVPADAVTRQLGKKEAAIAVCYCTLKAYVKESLTDIASCIAFR
jgi:hypothetical protein